jgi:hypothetical protein
VSSAIVTSDFEENGAHPCRHQCHVGNEWFFGGGFDQTTRFFWLNQDGSVIEFLARLSGLEEITRWVLSWGSKAQVLGPVALKKRVKDELIAMVKATENV